jgi:hypothetical protein
MSKNTKTANFKDSPFMEDVRALAKTRAATYLAAAVAVAGVFGVFEELNTGKNIAKGVTNLENISMIGSPIIVKAGANLRSTPEVNNEADVPGNIVGQVPAGEELVVPQPLQSFDNPGWIAVILPDTKQSGVSSIKDLAERTVWIDTEDPGHIGTPSHLPHEPSNAEINASVSISDNGEIQLQSATGQTITDPYAGLSYYQNVKTN